MKRYIIFTVLIIMALFSLNAQGFYFDVGLGIGLGWSNLDTGSSNTDSSSFEFPIKAGYGPILNKPLYITGNLGLPAHILSIDENNHIECTYVTIGPGVIFYPVPSLQLAGSIGWAAGDIRLFGNAFVDTPFPTAPDGSLGYEGTGFAYDISAAFDFGRDRSKHGFLMGLKFFGAFVALQETRDILNTHTLTAFFKYAFRHKSTNIKTAFLPD
jgi:hypothetical protein